MKKDGIKEPTTIQYFRGKSILYFLIYKANQGFVNKYQRGLALFIGVLRGYLPTVFYNEKWSLLPGEDLTEQIVFAILNFTLIHSYYYVTRFVL